MKILETDLGGKKIRLLFEGYLNPKVHIIGLEDKKCLIRKIFPGELSVEEAKLLKDSSTNELEIVS